MSSTRIAVATLSAAVLSACAALTMGQAIGDTIRGTADATPTSSTAVYELPAPKTIGKQVGATLDYLPNQYGPEHVDCQPFILAEGVDYTHLTDAGYFGLPDDGMEALYAPECAGSL